MDKKILIYFGDHTDKQTILQRVLQDLQLPFQFLCDDDLTHTCGYLMSLEGFDAQKKEGQYHFEDDLMLLKDIEDDEIHAINALLNAMGSEMKRKAMLTEHNRYWYVCDLMQEIQQEHQYFQTVENIQTLLSQSKDLIIEDYTQDSWKRYEDAFYKAYACISQKHSVQDVKTCYHELLTAKKHLKHIK